MSVPEKRHSLMEGVARLTMFRRAAEFVGQARLAEGMGVADRTVRAKLASERGLTDADLLGAAVAVEARAAELSAFAAKIRERVGCAPAEAA